MLWDRAATAPVLLIAIILPGDGSGNQNPFCAGELPTDLCLMGEDSTAAETRLFPPEAERFPDGPPGARRLPGRSSAALCGCRPRCIAPGRARCRAPESDSENRRRS